MKRRIFLRTFLRTGVASGISAAIVPTIARSSETKPAATSGTKIQAISTDRAPKPGGPYSQAIKANGFIFVSGEIGRDPKTGQIVEGGITAETERIMENLKAILEAAGSSLDRAVKTTVYLKDMGDFEAMGKIYARYFPSNPPARATIEVARLHFGRVEIELTALA